MTRRRGNAAGVSRAAADGGIKSRRGAGKKARPATDTRRKENAPRPERNRRPVSGGQRKRRRRRALVTTKTEEKDIASAAIHGARVSPRGEKTPAAIGMQTAL